MPEEKYLNDTIKNKYHKSPFRIPLRNRHNVIMEFALVEEADFERVNQHRWHLSGGYANATINMRNIRMHHFVFKRPDEDRVIDHINQDKLDNRRCNLRETTHAGNTNNIAKTNMNTSSQYKGVNFQKNRDTFRSRYNEIALYTGTDERQAAMMYDIYTFQLFGEHANNNRLLSYEEAMKHTFEWKEKEERSLPKHISMTKCYFRVKRNFRNKQYVFFLKTMEEAKIKLDEINLMINHTLLMEELLYMFSPATKNTDGIEFIAYKEHEILVDNDMWHEFNKQKWYVDSKTGYAYNNDLKTMHSLLCPTDDKSKVVHHINGNRIDNRRQNLEIVSASENAHQKKEKSKSASSQYFGVTFHKLTNKWMAHIKKNHIKYYLGIYENEMDAAKAYNQKALELYGHSANLNLVEMA